MNSLVLNLLVCIWWGRSWPMLCRIKEPMRSAWWLSSGWIKLHTMLHTGNTQLVVISINILQQKLYMDTLHGLPPFLATSPLWRAADAEIKVPSVENTELKGSPFKAWSRSVFIHTCYTYCQGSSLLISTLLVHSPSFFPKPLTSFSYLG